MDNAIRQEEVDFENEPEPHRFLKKADVEAEGSMVMDVIDFKKEIRFSERTKKEYTTYSMLLRDDKSTEYHIDGVFRNELRWGKRPVPTAVKLTVDKRGKYLEWCIMPVEEKVRP